MFATATNNNQRSADEKDPRPRFGIGHLSIPVGDVAGLTEFYEKVGMRVVVNMGRASILELRGGTHLILRSGTPASSTLDVIVDDIDETRAVFVSVGADPGPIRRGSPHDQFTVNDPEGNVLIVNSNHAIGPV